MDDPELLGGGEIRGFLRAMARTNRWFGGTAMVCRAVRPLIVEEHRRGARPVRIADAGTGCGEVPATLVPWARQRGIPVSFVAIDLLPEAVEEARRRCASLSEVTVVQADARDVLRSAASAGEVRQCPGPNSLPVQNSLFDIVIASLILHHFNEDEVAAWLALMASAARRGIVVSDLQRGLLPWIAVRLGALLVTGNAAFRHDAPLSILRAYTLPEWMQAARRAKLRGVQLKGHSLGRILLQARGAARVVREDDAASLRDQS